MVSNEILILKLIDGKASLNPLRKRGFSHSQIALLLQKVIDLGYVEYQKDDILLTSAGKKVLVESLAALEYSGKNAWILPQKEYYKTPVSSKNVFLPKKI